MFSNIGFAPPHPPTPDPSSDLQSTLIENFFHTARVLLSTGLRLKLKHCLKQVGTVRLIQLNE